MRTALFGLLLLAASISPVAYAQTRTARADIPRPNVRWDATPYQIGRIYSDAKDQLDTDLAAIAAIPDTDRTFNNTIQALDFAQARFSEKTNILSFLSQVSPDKSVRQAAMEMDSESRKYLVGIAFREDLFNAVNQYAGKNQTLNGENQLLLDATVRSFVRNGFRLQKSQRDDIQAAYKRLSEISVEFEDNINNAKGGFDLTPEQLKAIGLSDGYIQGLAKAPGGKVHVGLSYPEVEPFMDQATDAKLREKLDFDFSDRAADKNVALLEEAVSLRSKIATTMGFPTWADYRIAEGRVVQSVKEVWDFLTNLKNLLAPHTKKDMDDLLARKRQDDPTAERVEQWDRRYYGYKLQKERYDFDPEKVREYFPVDTVVKGTLEIYQEVLHVKFTEVQGPNAWHKDVKLYEISDEATGRHLGHFYLDIYPRKGKYSHAAAFTLVQARELEDGSYLAPVSAMVANLNKPSADKPALLSHDDVETFFHEFGHLMHQTLTQVRYPDFSGSNVAQDYVEALSQMLENYVWRPESLARISGHYKDPTQKLPKDLLDKMLAARNHLVALDTMRQIALASFDMTIHTAAPPVDTTAVMFQIYDQLGLPRQHPGTHYQASFGHMLGGYDAGYYGYQLSRADAADLFTRFEKNIFDRQVGLDYRNTFLALGGVYPPKQLYRWFLGRATSIEAYLRSLGLEIPKPAPPAAGAGSASAS